jgi:class 3 adenylate cyclase
MIETMTLNRTKTIDDNRAFSELFVERHENVSILFADICNFTQLTTRLTVEKLVDTLNDLFGKVII